ncbi:hypothetical protein CROQUDRAFT_188922 [Cronartium quercuum f. sp. fusiforme G11]|uniref:PAS domain-containing protein n=1 Tax=Cronartium quercuum f. sp. fusiforme G11 TaxID=708437 RepID=A0A9P6NGT1_9BASI|nr:hypothetical protein CROQUDRAFT_188922 [Cronartium quercuum f. sp. fusiforme G11]
MRDHEQQLFHYHHRRPPSSRTMRSTTSLARSHTVALSDADSTSRSFVNQLKFALRKTPLSPTRSAIPELEAEPGSAIAALGSGLTPFKERVSIFKSTFSQLLIFERHSYKVVYINRDCLPFFGLPTESEEDVLSPAVLHHNFLESIYGENAKRTKELRSLVHDGVTSGRSVSCQCVLKWDLGVKLKPNSLRQTYTRLQHKSSYQSSYSCSIYLTPFWTMNKKCVVYTALVM